jgi:hypothetical protein
LGHQQQRELLSQRNPSLKDPNIFLVREKEGKNETTIPIATTDILVP